jgi:hypothetical protein
MTKMIAPNGATVNVPEEKADRLLALGFKAPGDKQAADSKSPYAPMKVGELKAEIESRNEGRDEADLLSLEGKKADIIAVLDADDSASDDE